MHYEVWPQDAYPPPLALEKGQEARCVSLGQAHEGRASPAHELLDLAMRRLERFGLHTQPAGGRLEPLPECLTAFLRQALRRVGDLHQSRGKATLSCQGRQHLAQPRRGPGERVQGVCHVHSYDLPHHAYV